jgi:hypothetical protein
MVVHISRLLVVLTIYGYEFRAHGDGLFCGDAVAQRMNAALRREMPQGISCAV